MAGTDRTQEPVKDGGPAVILVDPQLGENIGMVARAMLNCGLTELRLVRPRDGWPSEKAEAAASGDVRTKPIDGCVSGVEVDPGARVGLDVRHGPEPPRA